MIAGCMVFFYSMPLATAEAFTRIACITIMAIVGAGAGDPLVVRWGSSIYIAYVTRTKVNSYDRRLKLAVGRLRFRL